MSGKPRRPAEYKITAVRCAAVLLAGAGAYFGTSLLRPSKTELVEHIGKIVVPGVHAAVIEEAWLENRFRPLRLAAAVDMLPCPDGLGTVPARTVHWTRNAIAAEEGGLEARAHELLAQAERADPVSWLPPLVRARLYVRHGRLGEAEVLMQRYLNNGPGRNLLQRVGYAAREEVLAAIHLLQVSAYIQIDRNRTEGRLWRDFKDPIGYAKLLSQRGETGAEPGMPSWTPLPIPAPGCPISAGVPTTLDLYNNLIVGYLQASTYTDSPERRAAEFTRGYRESAQENPLKAVLDSAILQSDSLTEGWRWALSNSERIVRELPWRRGADAVHITPWLALTLSQVAERARRTVPREGLATLDALNEVLTRVAHCEAAVVPEVLRAAYTRALTGATLRSGIRDGRALETIAGDSALDSAEQQLSRAVHAALSLRTQPEQWARTVLDAPDSLQAALGDGYRDWLSASRRDLSAALASHAVGADPAQYGVWAKRSRTILGLNNAPLELRQLEARIGWWARIPGRQWLVHPVALAVAAVLFAHSLGTWIALQLRFRRALFTSFYRLEVKEHMKAK